MKKRLLSLILALAAAFALCAGASAAELAGDITDASEDFGYNGYYLDGVWHKYGAIYDLAHLYNTRPGTEIFVPFSAKDFEWDGSRLPINPRSASQLGFNLEYTNYLGDCIKQVTLTSRENEYGLLVRFVDKFPSTEVEEFEAEAIISVSGSGYGGVKFKIEGTFGNRNRFVYATTKDVQLGVGRTATAYNDAYGVRFDLGLGVTMTGDILFYNTVYGAADDTVLDTDRAVMQKYPQIAKAIHLDTVGLRGSVRFDKNKYGVMYVYDENLTYLGTTEGPVRQEWTYYLATSRISA